MYFLGHGKMLRIIKIMAANWEIYQALGTNSKRALRQPLDYGIGQRKGYPYNPKRKLVQRLSWRFSTGENEIRRELIRLRIHFLQESGHTLEEIKNYGISLP